MEDEGKREERPEGTVAVRTSVFILTYIRQLRERN
jgi:hypothetical protein